MSLHRILCFALVLFVYSCASTGSAKKERVFVAAPVLAAQGPSIARCAALFEQHCQRCHDLPIASRYSESQWQRIMPAMARKSKIDAPTQDSITSFVNAARSEGK